MHTYKLLLQKEPEGGIYSDCPCFTRLHYVWGKY